MEDIRDLVAEFSRLHKLRASLLYRELQREELTGPQLFILRELFQQEPKKLGDLAQSVHLSNSTVSGIVDRLERDGLVVRKRDEQDRRVVWIETTERCLQLKKTKIEALNRKFYEGLEHAFAPAQLETCKEVVGILIKHLERKLEGTV
ncbi:MarR family winged helix-turn-helix transcriptional regulator [Paenibacillus sp. GCM10023248]|uniref:MarR family winged helix-turn-helix transcriptional regulator n=1 Tax=Bacillales TaxID=1385 RepID=UPI002377FAD3|nr:MULTISPECIES: MarR family transcriptional regulator [Bacillales]MDD9272282.1 MarR family transcriptional regulator [Paenibacillus sp. MAHUQ-63]MDR6885491.1 DNA-binding MarR family transcriptional regulator [Bacillus sp. 3255]